jgi:PAS domain S-box-containing protein
MSTRVIHAREAESLRVLLVEDNAVDAKLITGLLRSPCVECSHVMRLDEALLRLGSDHPDVILLDLNLDDSAGYETFHRVRQATARAAILILSGSNDEELAIKTVREGAQDYIVKGSFDGRLLLRSIRYAIERKKSQEALRQSEVTVRAIFENSLDGILIFEDSGKCLEANAALAALVGVPRDQLIGNRLCDLCEGGLQEIWSGLAGTKSGEARSGCNRRMARGGWWTIVLRPTSCPAST